MDEKTLAISVIAQFIGCEISHSGIESITENTVNKAKEILTLISNSIA